jgi:uncharacterized membrane protein
MGAKGAAASGEIADVVLLVDQLDGLVRKPSWNIPYLRPFSREGGVNMSRRVKSHLTPILDRNIRALVRRRDAELKAASLEIKVADAITAFTGSMRFVYLHLFIFGFWLVANLNWIPGVPAWDESFVILAMVASVEAIFLSTFVLISQNRMAEEADRRADLDLQISLLTEHEITELAKVTEKIAKRVGIDESERQLKEVEKDIQPEEVLDEIEEVRH